MRNCFLCKTIVALVLLIALWSCAGETGPWAEFKACATTACVDEVVAVQEAFLKEPGVMLERFEASSAQGEDHVIGWLYILRDSVLTNEAYASREDRYALQQALIGAAQPYANDPKYGEMAGMIIDEVSRPNLEAPTEAPARTDEEIARLIENEWVSVQDTQAVVLIGKGQYTDFYGGEQLSSSPYEYYPVCPADCNPIADGPCLKVMGENGDAPFCYTVVHVDSTTLELSMIGGRGNTLVYTRKD